jgi:hypothetical protein
MSRPEPDDQQLDRFCEAMAELAYGLWQLEEQATANASASVPADATEENSSGKESAISCEL